jgi:ABC-2 type transport system ATP-binding protein
MALTADHLIVIGRGRLIRDEGVNDFIEASSQRSVRVSSPQVDQLVALLQAAGAKVRPLTEGAIEVLGTEAAAIGEMAAAHGVVLHELTPQKASLEEAFMELTSDSVEYHATGAVA